MSPTFQIASKNDHVNIDYIFSYSSHKTGFDISCRLYPLETICMKCQNLFSGPKKEKKIISKYCLLKFLPRVLSVKDNFCTFDTHSSDYP